MCEALSRLGHSVTLLNANVQSPDKNTEDLFEYYGLSGRFSFVQAFIPYPKSRLTYALGLLIGAYRVGTILRKVEPDLVIGRYLPGCSVGMLLGFNVVFESHAPIWNSRVNGVLFSWMLNKERFKTLVVITRSLKTAYRSKYKDKLHTNIVVAPDAADVVNRALCPIKVIKKRDALQVGYCGHLYRGKGVELIIDLANSMAEVDFHIVGGLEEDIKRFTDLPNLKFHGFVKHAELGEYISQFDVGLAPIGEIMHGYKGSSRRDVNLALYTSPLKIFEYMAYGLPVIASRLPVIEEIVTTDFGILADPSNIQEWKKAIITLTDERLRQNMGNRAKTIQRKKYSWEVRAKNILSLSIA